MDINEKTQEALEAYADSKEDKRLHKFKSDLESNRAAREELYKQLEEYLEKNKDSLSIITSRPDDMGSDLYKLILKYQKQWMKARGELVWNSKKDGTYKKI